MGMLEPELFSEESLVCDFRTSLWQARLIDWLIFL